MLAGPQVLRTPKEERVLTNIEFCLDVSGSMGGRRYEMASEAVEEFIDAREGDAFGLTLFGSHQIRWTPLTTDLDAIRQALPFANPRNQPMHMVGTMIGAALEFCHDNMIREADQGDRMIVLVSDGFSADLASSGAQAESGEMLKSAQITLYHVHVGSGAVPTSVADLRVKQVEKPSPRRIARAWSGSFCTSIGCVGSLCAWWNRADGLFSAFCNRRTCCTGSSWTRASWCEVHAMVISPISALGIAIAVALVVAIGEWLHAARIRRVARLAFGVGGRPSAWVAIVPPLRICAAGAAAWGLLMLATLDPQVGTPSHRGAHPSTCLLRWMFPRACSLRIPVLARKRFAVPSGRAKSSRAYLTGSIWAPLGFPWWPSIPRRFQSLPRPSTKPWFPMHLTGCRCIRPLNPVRRRCRKVSTRHWKWPRAGCLIRQLCLW